MPADDNSWFLLDSGAAGAEENMAVDEALLEASLRMGSPVLRFYRWSSPAVSFGYSQKYADVSSWTALRPLVRRPTGGGMVAHGPDWTYSLVFPRGHSWHRAAAIENYRRLHEWIRFAFASIGLDTELSSGSSNGLAGQCFSRPEESDLLCCGKKIAGAAQRRSRHGLLIQGSIQAESIGVEETVWRRAMTACASSEKQAVWIDLRLDSEVRQRVCELLHDKYLNPDYLRKR